MPSSYSNLKTISEKNGELSLSAEISTDVLREYVQEALARTALNFEMPGFRKGKVPLATVREHMDEADLFETAVDRALRDAIREIVGDEKLNILGVPQLEITKAEPDAPIAFTVRFAIFPEMKLPDYKKIGQTIFERKDIAEITDDEVTKALNEFRGMIAPKKSPADEDITSPLSELTDEEVKRFGDFKTVGEFRAELKKQLLQQKELGAKEAKREEMIEKIVKDSKVTVPKLLIDQEWRKASEERAAHLQESGISFADYLKESKKTEQELEKEARTFIEAQIKTSLVFREIQKQENVTATEQEIHANMAYLIARYPDRDKSSLHQTAEAFILQEKLFDLLSATAPTETKL